MNRVFNVGEEPREESERGGAYGRAVLRRLRIERAAAQLVSDDVNAEHDGDATNACEVDRATLNDAIDSDGAGVEKRGEELGDAAAEVANVPATIVPKAHELTGSPAPHDIVHLEKIATFTVWMRRREAPLDSPRVRVEGSLSRPPRRRRRGCGGGLYQPLPLHATTRCYSS